MKRVNKGFLHFIFQLVLVFFITVSLSSCHMTSYFVISQKYQIIDKLKRLQEKTGIRLKQVTSRVAINKNNELTEDYRYDRLFK